MIAPHENPGGTRRRWSYDPQDGATPEEEAEAERREDEYRRRMDQEELRDDSPGRSPKSGYNA